MFTLNNRINRHGSGVFIIKLEYIWHVSSVFCWDCTCKCRMEYFILLSKFICFRSGSRSPVTFKTNHSVATATTVSIFPIFCNKELHFKCCLGVELNIVTWLSAILGKYEKLILLDALKIYIVRDFLHQIKFLVLNIIDRANINSVI